MIKSSIITRVHSTFGVAALTVSVLALTAMAAPAQDRGAEKERPHGKARIAETDRDHAKAHAPKEMAERRHELERALKRSIEELNDLRAAGKERAAAEAKERVLKLENALARMEQPGRRTSPERHSFSSRPERPAHAAPEMAERHRRLHHLQAAVENLHAAGMHEPAERLAQEAERMRQQFRAAPPPGFQARPHVPDSHHRPHGPAPMHAMREMEQLRAELEALRQTVRQLRGRVDELSRDRR